MAAQRIPMPVLYAGVMGMELSYLYLGLDLFRDTGPGWVSFVLVLSLYPMAFFFKWLISRSPGTASRTKMLVVLSGAGMISLIALLAVLRLVSLGFAEAGVFLVIVQILFGGVTWWLGSSLVRDELGHQYLCARFQIGLLVMLLVTMASGASFLPVLLFFVLALVVLAAARWESSVLRSPVLLQALPRSVLVWGSLAVLLPATAIFFLLSPDAARAIVGSIAAVVGFIGRLFPAERSPATPTPSAGPGFSCACKTAQQSEPVPSPPPPGPESPESPVVLWIIILVVYIAVLILVAMAIRRMRARRREAQTGVTAIKSSRARVSIIGTLTGFLRNLVNRLVDFLRSLLRLDWARRRSAQREEPATSVRSLYLSLLRLAAKRGTLRQPSQTPLEFLKQLCSAFPQREDDVALITRIYVRDRYGRQPLGDEGFRTARQAWQRITLPV